MSGEAAAQWLKETMRYGVACSLVDGQRKIGRNGTFEDACIKTRLRLTRQSIEVESGGVTVQWKELKSTEAHSSRPSSPVFRLANEEVFGRLTTVRWNQTGRQLQTSQHVHLVFPTRADVRAFRTGIGEVQRYGVGSVLAGHCADDAEAEPTAWHIERGREYFLRAIKSWRGRRLSSLADEAQGSTGAAEPGQTGGEPEEDGPPALGLAEDAEMHEKWCDRLAGRPASELSLEELQPLVNAGMPLKYRHVLWPQWLPEKDLGDIDELQSQAADAASKQVELDIPRTQPAWLGYENRHTLRRVLNAYAARDPRTGYCQGMNFLAMVFIVLGFSEAVVFAGLCHLLEDVCPGYHNLGLEGYLRDTAVLGVLVHRKLPAVHQCLEAHDLQLNILALDHFVTLASRSWPLWTTVRLWDIILLEGSPAVFASFLAALELYLLPAAERVRGQEAEANVSPADVMQQFKWDSRRGAIQESEKLLQCTRRWIPHVPRSQIDWLRSEITSEDTS
mmetsp:Transcript_67004/g.195917  ORF Transcript_67004/g.195917 Transcript_67004/m.195917 type:complete len:505 (+) Transcript_67004:73-1587(+)